MIKHMQRTERRREEDSSKHTSRGMRALGEQTQQHNMPPSVSSAGRRNDLSRQQHNQTHDRHLQKRFFIYFRKKRKYCISVRWIAKFPCYRSISLLLSQTLFLSRSHCIKCLSEVCITPNQITYKGQVKHTKKTIHTATKRKKKTVQKEQKCCF